MESISFTYIGKSRQFFDDRIHGKVILENGTVITVQQAEDAEYFEVLFNDKRVFELRDVICVTHCIDYLLVHPFKQYQIFIELLEGKHKTAWEWNQHVISETEKMLPKEDFKTAVWQCSNKIRPVELAKYENGIYEWRGMSYTAQQMALAIDANCCIILPLEINTIDSYEFEKLHNELFDKFRENNIVM